MPALFINTVPGKQPLQSKTRCPKHEWLPIKYSMSSAESNTNSSTGQTFLEAAAYSAWRQRRQSDESMSYQLLEAPLKTTLRAGGSEAQACGKAAVQRSGVGFFFIFAYQRLLRCRCCRPNRDRALRPRLVTGNGASIMPVGCEQIRQRLIPSRFCGM